MNPSNDPTAPTSLHWVDSSGNQLLATAAAITPPCKIVCANNDPDVFRICGKDGDLVCSACRLVSYCSAPCQKEHWKKHKIDCSNPMRSADWKPSYVEEKRKPSWIRNDTLQDGKRRRDQTEFATGKSLWNNMPAFDVIKLDHNEKDCTQDFNIALSGREPFSLFMQTIAALPEDYSGKLQFFVSNQCEEVIGRFLLAVLVLDEVSDPNMAVDMVIHLFYSVFLPKIYLEIIKGVVKRFAEHLEDGFYWPGGGPGYVKLSQSPYSHVISLLRKWEHSTLTMNSAQSEYDRMRNAPHREDFRGRMYSSLRPSHRVAFLEFRQFGLVLPFGAPNAHFNAPNVTLFSTDSGKWLQTDHADPLNLFDYKKMIEAGQAHGTREEDIYGCLYFYLFDRLHLVLDRLQRWDISIGATPTPIPLVPVFVPPELRFHRIEVANMVDYNYVGIETVLRSIGPLLHSRPGSAVIAYFMNWAEQHSSGAVLRMGRAATMDFEKDGWMAKIFEQLRETLTHDQNDPLVSYMGSNVFSWAQLSYEDSQQFEQYLERKNLPNVLRETALRRRERNTIVPHRLHARLGDERTGLPVIENLEEFYYKVQIRNSTFVERFVEFVRE